VPTTSILITGVAGFLGSNLLGKLLENGHRVVGIDNLSMGSMSNLYPHLRNPNFRFVKADARDPATFEKISEKISCAVHLAAYKIPRYGKAIETLHVNYHCTDNVLKFARDRGCKCVLASTSDVYGRNPNVPFSEERSDCVIGDSQSPRWAYAVSKLFDEHLALAYQDAYGFPVVLLRFFGSYGPNQALSWWGGPPPVFIEAVLTGNPIPIHGDGQQTRSFTYVSDTVQGIYEAVLRKEANGQIFNIGSSEEVTIVELANRIQKAAGLNCPPRIEFVPYESFTGKKYEDVQRRVPDTTFAKKVLGFEAQVSLDEGLKRTIAWQQEVTRQRSFGG
jgi:UDP-glucose 4-epimerase